MKIKITSFLTILLGIIQIMEYSIIDTQVKLVIHFLKIAILFTLVGYNLPKTKKAKQTK